MGVQRAADYDFIVKRASYAAEVRDKIARDGIYPKKTFAQMSKKDRIRACYQHCCLKYLEKEPMTNQTFRGRMSIEEKNAAMVSRIIKETVNAGYIKGFNPDSASKKHAKYVPFWA
ncbi:MAG: hypothetical protein LBH92_04640 [Bacteroidales bacterium]|jgi:predicted HTH transcriptional regulator|nr:hypothetical protein [Bacteroidales bacterium]